MAGERTPEVEARKVRLNFLSAEIFARMSPYPRDSQAPQRRQARCPFHKFAASQAAARLYGLGG